MLTFYNIIISSYSFSLIFIGWPQYKKISNKYYPGHPINIQKEYKDYINYIIVLLNIYYLIFI